MYSIERLLVAMELNEHDDVVFGYINRMAKVLPIQKIVFLHVAENLDIPKELVEKYPGLIPPIDQTIELAILKKIKSYDQINEIEDIEVIVKDGRKAQTISSTVREKNIDMLVINRTDNHDFEVAFLQKITRTVPCSVALVPPSVPANINNLLVPIDFSNNSSMALKHAIEITKNRPEMSITGLHIFKMPSGYFKTGLSYDEFADELLKNAKQQFDVFLKENKINPASFVMHYKLKRSDSIPYMINRFSFANQIDAVIIGSRGRDTLSSFVLGSITEAMIDRDQYLPLIVIKHKGKNMKLWDALLEL